jgi:hypothetical protein
MTQPWKYSDAIAKQRQDRLFSFESFTVIADRIEQEMSILCYHVQGCDDDSKYARAVFCGRVCDELFDAFFNSPKGYRGSYFESPFHGLECNRYLMKKLFPRLSDWAAQNSPGYNAQFSQDSLLAVSGKAWLAEIPMELCEFCKGEWSHPTNDQAEIINGRWDKSHHADAKYGRKAPQHSKIRLFGAFLSVRVDEFVPARKRDRHLQIYHVGWS